MTKQTEAMKLALEVLETNRRTHYYCEDTWYSCPKHEEGCANEAEGDACNCGADSANVEIEKAITALREALAEESSGTEQPAPVAWFPPDPPPECKSEAEKTAFAFGWFKALEAQRALDKKAENTRELGLDYEPTQPQQEPVARKWIFHGGFADVARFDAEGFPYFYSKESVTKFMRGQLSAPCKGKNCGSLNGWLHSAECRAEHEAQYTAPQPAPPQQEPVAKVDYNHRDGFRWLNYFGWQRIPDGAKLYTSPPASKPLTNEEIENVWERVQANDFHDCVQPFARAIEAKLKEKNT